MRLVYRTASALLAFSALQSAHAQKVDLGAFDAT
jgi:hypothetical protein